MQLHADHSYRVISDTPLPSSSLHPHPTPLPLTTLDPQAKGPSNKMPVSHISSAVDNSQCGGHLKSHSPSISLGGDKITMTSPPLCSQRLMLGLHGLSRDNAHLICHFCQGDARTGQKN